MSIQKVCIITKERIINVKILSVEIQFSDWLQGEIDRRGWSWNKLAEMAGLSSGTIYNIRDGTRGVGKDSLEAIAQALRLPTDIVYRAAGFLTSSSDKSDPLASEAAHLVGLLSEEKKQIAVDYIRFLVEMEEKKRRK